MSVAIQFNQKYFLLSDDLNEVVKQITPGEFNEACVCAGEPLVSTEVELPAVLVKQLDKLSPNMQRLGDWEISYFDEYNELREKSVVYQRWGMWLENWAQDHCRAHPHYASFTIKLLKGW